jgi:transcription antitermination factor NusG
MSLTEDNIGEFTWYGLYCTPQHELATAYRLGRMGFGFIVPAEPKWTEKGKHTRITYRPVMPMYVFTGFRETPHFDKLMKDVPHLHGYMQFGFGPSVLKLDDAKWLFGLSNRLRGLQQPDVVEDVIRIGDRVEVMRGPFFGQSFTADKIVADRIHAIKEYLGAPRLFKIPVADVVRIG